MKLQILALVFLNALLTSTASAHPGPPGHTHPDEWPFEAIVVALIAGIAFVAFRKSTKRQ